MSQKRRPHGRVPMIACSLFAAVLAACGGGSGSSAAGDVAVATTAATASASAAVSADVASSAGVAASQATDNAATVALTLADAGSVADASAAVALNAKTSSTVAVEIAAEGQSFQVAGTMSVRFGVDNAWVTRSVAGSGTCSVAFFGADPGGVARACQVLVPASASTGSAVATAGLPAAETDTFYVFGTRTVQFGANGKFVSRDVTGRAPCTGAFFGDPNPGTVKTCTVVLDGASTAAGIALMPAVATGTLATAAAGYPTARVMAANVADPSQSPAPSDIGDFREVCDFSHMSYDDPIAAPGSVSGHLHTFFGNTGTNANSTATSIATTGNSTCAGGILNRTAYWVPSLIDTTDGTPQKPASSMMYYKQGYNGIASAAIRAFPAGLRMIAGNSASSSGQDNTGFTCYRTDNTWTTGKSIPTDCPPGATLSATVAFPQCWDGVNLDSPDHKSHMAYPGNGCPATHPVAVPNVTFNVNYLVGANGTSHWRLSSDSYDKSLPGGYSTHADWFNGWNADILNTWITRCINATLDCHAYLIGDGRMLY